MNIVVVIPVFEDWESAALLCTMIDSTLQKTIGHRITIFFVDDGSFSPGNDLFANQHLRAVDEVRVLRLRRNVGHQRAIAVGFSWVERHLPCDAVVVMDGDGEDLPDDIPALLDRAVETRMSMVVFAERGQRLEGRLFQSLYLCYRIAHRLLTGRGIRFGNFSVVPFCFLRRLTTMSELWGHYAAAVLNAKIPYATVRVNRGKRLRGATKMNMEALILHGLAAVAVYQTVSVRVLMGSAAVSGFFLLPAAAIAVMRIATGHTSPFWIALMGISLIMTCVTIFSTVLYVFTSLSFRHLMGVLPARDYSYFVDTCETVYSGKALGAGGRE
jgi:hypothetical protein